jgi:hypothetical protein
MFVCAALQGLGSDDVIIGWIAVSFLVLNFLALVQDFDQKQFVILVLIVVATLLLGWIAQLYGFPILSTVADWFFGFAPTFSTDAYLIIGLTLGLLFAWGMVTPIFDYWRFEPNEFVHYTQPIGRDMSIARLGCTVYKEVPDVLEFFLLFGGGTLVIARQEQVLATIRRVPFLSRRMETVEHLLSETRVFEQA